MSDRVPAGAPRRALRIGFALLCLLGLIGVNGPLLAQEAAPAVPNLRIVYLSREADPAYAEVPADDGVFRPALPAPYPGAELALKDTRPMAHALGLTLSLDHRVLAPDAPIEAEAARIAGESAAAVIADLPREDMVALAKALPAAALPVFNIRHRADALRRDLCATGVFHVVPSTAMLTDALAQFVVRKNWRKVLVLHGPEPDDLVLADAFQSSAKKFGARIVDTKAFILGNDPRKRGETNVALLTGSDDFDVLFLADTGQDFGRYVPYTMSKPRPVIGTEGLRAEAWDAIAERFGAPQVNHRFERVAHRPMTEYDWAAWVAVRAVIEAAARRQAFAGPAIAAALAHDELPMDISKGIQSSFRPWDRQFRQGIMLSTADVVIETAPIEGFLHRKTPLDTLGVDEPEFVCKTAAP